MRGLALARKKKTGKSKTVAGLSEYIYYCNSPQRIKKLDLPCVFCAGGLVLSACGAPQIGQEASGGVVKIVEPPDMLIPLRVAEVVEEFKGVTLEVEYFHFAWAFKARVKWYELRALKNVYLPYEFCNSREIWNEALVFAPSFAEV